MDDFDISTLVKELEGRGMVKLYSVGGSEYAEIPSFTTHQVINNRERESSIPAPGRERKEGKGREGRKEREIRVSAPLSRVKGFEVVFENYKQMRKSIRKPLTEHAETLAFGLLEKLQADGNDPIKVLEQSILSGWQGLYQLKEQDHDRTGLESDLERRNREYLDREESDHEATRSN